MKLPNFDDPKLSLKKAQELPLSGTALLILMRAVLDKGLPFRFRALGWSMTPFIRNDDVITITPITRKKVGIGDIVAFLRPAENKLVVHRIISKRDGTFYIQGDNATDCPAENVPVENILAKVTLIERKGHYVWLGLGLERYIIAWLSRIRLLNPLRLLIYSSRRSL